MHGVVSAHRMPLGKLARRLRLLRVDGDHVHRRQRFVEVRRRPPELAGGDPAGALCRGEGRPGLGIGEKAGDPIARIAPQLLGGVRPGLANEELDERRGVEVCDQRRCSATRSDTDAFTRGRLRRGSQAERRGS